MASCTWNTVVVWSLLRSNEHQTALVMAVVGIVWRHEYWKTGAIFQAVCLAAVEAAFHILHLRTETYRRATNATNRILTIGYTMPSFYISACSKVFLGYCQPAVDTYKMQEAQLSQRKSAAGCSN